LIIKIHFRKSITNIEFLNIDSPSEWISDFDYKLIYDKQFKTKNFIKVEFKMNAPLESGKSEVIATDGKWRISYFESESSKYYTWRLINKSNIYALVQSSKNKKEILIDVKSNSIELLKKVVRLLIINPEIVSRGLFYLHGSILKKENRIILILGPKESGKTTYTFAALQNGWEVLAEDLVLINNDYNIVPFFPTLYWESRVKLSDLRLICKIFGGSSISEKYLSSEVDNRGRIAINHDYKNLYSVKNSYAINNIILLDENISKIKNNCVQVDTEWLYQELINKKALYVACDIYNTNFKNISFFSKKFYQRFPSVNTIIIKKSGDLKTDLINFIGILEKK